MSYKIEVRTDIMNPCTYVQVELYYKELLELIELCGGYVFYKQLYKWFGGQTKGFREIKKLEELQIVGSEEFNNNKYIYLKLNALKYLKYRDYEGEVLDPKVNRLRIRPGFRPVLTSAYAFESLLQRKEYINTNKSMESLESFAIKAKEEFLRDRMGNIEFFKFNKEDCLEELKIKLKILGDRNAIFLKNYAQSDTFTSSFLEFVWFDFNHDAHENQVLKTLKLISKFVNNLGTTGKINKSKFTLEIITTSNERKEIIEKLSNKALKTIEKKNTFYLKNNNVKVKENPVISGIKEIRFDILEDVEGYLKNSSRVDGYSFVSESVINKLEHLSEELKTND